MNGKILWSNLITPGFTTVSLQADYNLRLTMIDSQVWCEAHRKMCQKFMFGCLMDSGFGPTFLELKPPSGGIS